VNPSIDANNKLGSLVQISLKMEEHLRNLEEKFSNGGKPQKNNVQDNENPSENKSLQSVAGLASSVSTLIESVSKMDKNAGEKLTSFMNKFLEIIKEFEKNNVDSQKVEGISNSINILSQGSSKFLKEMALSAIFGLPALIGTTLFAANIKLLFSIIGNVQTDTTTINTIEGIVKISSKILLFGGSLALYSIVGPVALAGSLLFAGTMKLLLSSLKTANQINDPMIFDNISKLGKAIGLISVPLVLLSFVKKQFAEGALTFSLGVFAILGIISMVGSSLLMITAGLQGMGSIMGGIALFSLTMVLLSYATQEYFVGTLVFTLGISAMLIIFKQVATLFPVVMAGLVSIGQIVKGAAKFSLAMVLLSFAAKPFATGILTFALGTSALLLIYGIVAKAFPQVLIASRALEKIARVSVRFSLVIIGVGLLSVPFAIGALVFSLGSVAVGGALATIGLLNKAGFVTSGTNVIQRITIPALLFAISTALISNLIKDSPDEYFEKMKVVGMTIAVMGISASIIGVPPISGFAMAGAGILISLSASLMIFSLSLGLLSLINLEKINNDKLKAIVITIAEAFALAGLYSIPIAFGSVSIVLAGISLLTLLPSLFLFKILEWKPDDNKKINLAVTGIVETLKNAFSSIGVVGFAKLFAGAALLALLGASLVSLAIGMKAMSSLTFTEMEYDEKSKKLIPKREVRLTSTDFKNAAENVKLLLNTLKDPLLEFGKAADEGTLFGLGVGRGYLQKGIDTAATIGSAITNIAKGVSDMANFIIIDYEVINKGTPEAKLVPKEARKLNNGDFINASKNVETILTTLTKPLLDFGQNAEKGSGIFSGGFMQKGIETAKGIGEFIANIAEGVVKMANGEVILYEVINKGTPEAKLVPKDVTKLKEEDYTNAASNVTTLLETLGKPLVEFGKNSKEGSGLFSDGYMEIATETISKIGQPIASMADMVIKMSSGEIVVNEIVEGKLVPKEVLSFEDALVKSKSNLSELLKIIPQELVKFGEYVKDNKKNFERGEEAIPILENSLKGMASATESYLKITQNILDSQKSGIKINDVFTSLSKSIQSVGDGLTPLTDKKIENFKSLVSSIKDLTSIVSPFEKFMKDFPKFVEEMGKFVNSWKTFGEENTKYFKMYSESVVLLSKVDTSKIKELTNALVEQTVQQQKIATTTTNKNTEEKTNTNVEKEKDTKDSKSSNNPESYTKTGTAKDLNYKENNSSNNNLNGKTIANLYVNNLIVKNN